jgi:site-specific DNA-methyltransferase (adenine-specific)|tara:strand:- start:41 stop:697 length:657 start_codon:yes stop_codon:yes gene_type:complete
MQLFHGDCLEVMKTLPDQSVDLILTDPPYGMEFKSSYRKIKYDKIKNDDNLYWLEDFVKLCFNKAKNNTAHYIFCSFHNIDKFKQAFEEYFTIKNILVWEKNNTSMGDLTADFAPKIEFIIFLQKGRKLINGNRSPNIFKFARTQNKYHPTEKPIMLMEHLISKFSNEKDVVLDPFMGSGTTAIASRNLNRKFIGIELDKKYFDTVNKRLGDYYGLFL